MVLDELVDIEFIVEDVGIVFVVVVDSVWFLVFVGGGIDFFSV